MFWRKKQVVADTTKVGSGAATPEATAEVKVRQPKVKPQSPKEVLTNKVVALVAGEAVTYHFDKTFGGALVHVELNPKYPNKGHKYTVALEKIEAGKPKGAKSVLWDSNNPKEIASWILERDGEPVS